MKWQRFQFLHSESSFLIIASQWSDQTLPLQRDIELCHVIQPLTMLSRRSVKQNQKVAQLNTINRIPTHLVEALKSVCVCVVVSDTHRHTHRWSSRLLGLILFLCSCYYNRLTCDDFPLKIISLSNRTTWPIFVCCCVGPSSLCWERVFSTHVYTSVNVSNIFHWVSYVHMSLIKKSCWLSRSAI